MGEPIPRPVPVPRCQFRNPHYGDLCGEPAVGEWESPDGERVPYCGMSAPKGPSERWYPYADQPAPAASPEPARCGYQSCPWHLRDWPQCVLPEGHDGAHDPGPGPHPWVPAAEAEAALAEGYQAGRMAERGALRDLLRKAIDVEDDERVHYEREVAELEKRAKANRECAEASRARADGLRALLARVEALS